MQYSLNKTGNSKTGKIPVSTSHMDTCPVSCPLQAGGCYAKHHFLGKYWKRLSAGEVKTATDYQGFLDKVKAMKPNTLWRHNQAGDLAHNEQIIDGKAIRDLVAVNTGKQGFTYTHHDMGSDHNRAMVEWSNDMGFTINLSSNSVVHADEYLALDIGPVVTLLRQGTDKVSYTPNGAKVVRCPAEDSDKVTCKSCKLCALSDRDYVIGFTAHGTGKKKVDLIASST